MNGNSNTGESSNKHAAGTNAFHTAEEQTAKATRAPPPPSSSLQEQTAKATRAPPPPSSSLLSCGLPPSLLALSILDFLTRDDVFHVMEVSQLKNQFRLDQFFCRAHGTLLREASDIQVILNAESVDEDACNEEDEDEAKAEEEEAGKKVNEENFQERDDGEKEPAITSNSKTCEDCIYKVYGMERCPICNDFRLSHLIRTCVACDIQKICLPCTKVPDADGFGRGICSECDRFYCGQKQGDYMYCFGVFSCGRCGKVFCGRCCSYITCDECCNVIGCHDCIDPDDYITCSKCSHVGCRYECQDWVECRRCDAMICGNCIPDEFDGFCSDTCNALVSKSCGDY